MFVPRSTQFQYATSFPRNVITPRTVPSRNAYLSFADTICSSCPSPSEAEAWWIQQHRSSTPGKVREGLQLVSAQLHISFEINYQKRKHKCWTDLHSILLWMCIYIYICLLISIPYSKSSVATHQFCISLHATKVFPSIMGDYKYFFWTGEWTLFKILATA